jgi:hypothetical protein
MLLGRYGTLLVLAMTVVGVSLIASTAAADASAYDSSLQGARDKVGALRGLGNTLQKASEEAPPPKLTADQIAEVKKYDAWLRTASERVVKLAASWEQKVEEIRAACQKDPSCNRIATAKALNETNMSFNLQYLQLQSQMQHENRSYTAVSNIMKTKHDTVKNSISNVR